MRINSSKKIHKRKRDPYQSLLRMAGILAIVVAAGFGLFFLSQALIDGEYRSKQSALERENIEAEQEFNTQLALKSSDIAASRADTDTAPGELVFWEKTLDGSVWRIEDESHRGLENTSVETLERSDLINGGLLLLNEWHSQPADFSDAALISISTTSSYQIQAADNSVRLFPKAYDALAALVEAAGEQGLKDYIVREAYRSYSVQEEMFNEQMERLSRDYSGDILIAQTKKRVNYPGTSDYQSGLSFRFDLYPVRKDEKFQQSAEGQWATENCWKYGVIFRFPTKDFPNPTWEDKSYKTGVSVSLNLYRYVGKAHAAAMKIMDYCLEEYIEFLADHPHICIYQDGALKYEVFRIPTSEVLPTYDVPYTNPSIEHQASLDNMGGVVLAYTYQ